MKKVVSYLFVIAMVLGMSTPGFSAGETKAPAVKEAPKAAAPAKTAPVVTPAPTNSVAPVKGNLKWKAVWCWSLNKKTPDEIKALVSQVKKLGFNVIIADAETNILESLIVAGKTEGIDVYKAFLFNKPDGNDAQVVTKEEKKALNTKIKNIKLKKYEDLDGIEPIVKDDIIVKEMQCFDKPAFIGKFQEKVTRLSFQHPGLKGIAFDWFGYKNYTACYCETSLAARDLFAKTNPNLKPNEVLARHSEESMINFINTISAAVTKANPEWKTLAHIHPYFKPNPYFGAKLKMDYVSYTASWFEFSTTDIGKVKSATEKNIKEAKGANKNAGAAPFIGIYTVTRPDTAKPADRITAELNTIKTAGAEAVIIAEISEIIGDANAAKAVSDSLGGSW